MAIFKSKKMELDRIRPESGRRQLLHDSSNVDMTALMWT